ncbi:MAG: extracellular solute-binding protein [Roseburia sp.]|nr:extracellular solute-binding protein [Roseburia sp.]
MKRMQCLLFACLLVVLTLTGCGKEDDSVIVLRVNSWEEYIDEGDWEEGEEIELEDGRVIFSETGIIEDFEEWFYETYGMNVRVEYSTFGTNEELYNQMTMGDTYDLVCPSEYMIMKLMAEGLLEPFSNDFYDTSIEENYYSKGVSPYIKDVFDELSINDQPLSKYAAGYMWGTLGIVYNPEFVSPEDAAHWNLLLSKEFTKRVTIKDSVRDAYFAGSCILNEEVINSKQFLTAQNYLKNLSELLNATDADTVNAVEGILSNIKDNVYSFETDSGKADMVTGKVVANQQWSGDAVYTLDQAEEDGVELCYSAPKEGTNLWFDGWCMIRAGIAEDRDKKIAAEAFINYVSRSENAVRNMNYIGYTSVISGGEDDTILQYIDWCYGADEDAEESLVEYPIGYFFGDEESDAYYITTVESQTRRQLFAQYPTKDVMEHCVVMDYFDPEENARINRMWTNARCFSW